VEYNLVASNPFAIAMCHQAHAHYTATLRCQGEFYEAMCTDIDPVKKQLVCCFPKDTGFPEACFQLNYDLLVVSVSGGSRQAGCGVDTINANKCMAYVLVWVARCRKVESHTWDALHNMQSICCQATRCDMHGTVTVICGGHRD
jgi:NADH dehydrogenase FAD-containing subunit